MEYKKSKFKFNPNAKPFEKKESPKKKFKQILKKYNIIKPKIIEDDNKFFFWKDLIQQYSNKNTMCIFLEDKTLLPENLRAELINCFTKYYKISPKDIILSNLSNKLIEHKIEIKEFNNEYNKLKNKINYYVDFLIQNKISKYVNKFENNQLRSLIFKLLDNLMKNTSIGDKIETDIYRYIEIENAINNIIKSSGIERGTCSFIRLPIKNEWFKITQKQIIECMERKLAMNMNSLPLPKKIKILQLIEDSIPSPSYEEINKLKKELKIKPLEFQIYLTAIPLEKKDSLVMEALDNIINGLNKQYKEHLLRPKERQSEIFNNELKYLSTLIYFRDFVFDVKDFISRFFIVEKSQMNSDLNLIQEMRTGKPKWDDNKKFKDVNGMIYL